jgi:phage regulator Rha-like protein
MELQLITAKIHEIRGQKVILDYDLAALYGIETKVLKQAIKRNLMRFPEDFMFLMNDLEFDNLRSQIVTSSWGGTRINPLAFTEHGVTMLASVLRSEIAIKMNISIVRAFVAMRKSIIDIKEISDQLSLLREKIGDHDAQLNEIYTAIENLLDDNSKQKDWDDRERIGFKNQS